MKPMKAAGAAQTQADWSTVLRITEAAALTRTSHLGKPATSTDTLRLVVDKLQVAWRWIERKRSQQLSSRRMRIAETVSLGEKRTISIIVVDGAQYLIGSSSSGVQLLTRLDQSTEQFPRDEVPS